MLSRNLLITRAQLSAHAILIAITGDPSSIAAFKDTFRPPTSRGVGIINLHTEAPVRTTRRSNNNAIMDINSVRLRSANYYVPVRLSIY